MTNEAIDEIITLCERYRNNRNDKLWAHILLLNNYLQLCICMMHTQSRNTEGSWSIPYNFVLRLWILRSCRAQSGRVWNSTSNWSHSWPPIWNASPEAEERNCEEDRPNLAPQKADQISQETLKSAWGNGSKNHHQILRQDTAESWEWATSEDTINLKKR